MTKIEDWATHSVLGNKVDHWRVTALLAKDASSLWQAVIDEREARENLDEASIDKASKELQVRIRILRTRLELVDYYLSGLLEGAESC